MPILSHFLLLSYRICTVTVTPKNKKVKAKKLYATISVKNPSIQFTDSVSEIEVGSTATVTATATPAATVKYYSADKNIATVGVTSGIVTAKAAGTVKIAAKFYTGSKENKVYKEITVKEATKAFEITSLEATAADTLVAKFANPVDDKATITVNKAGLTTAVDGKLTWDATKTVATFSATANLSAGTYTMTAKQDDATASKSVEVMNEYVKEIVITSTQALTDSGNKKTAYAFYDVLNQYGESLRLSTTVSWSSSVKTIVADKTTGKLTLTSDNEFVYGNQIYITGVYAKTGVSVQKAVTVGMERALNSVKAVGFVNKNKPSEKLDSLPVDFAKDTYYMIYETRDQDNNLMDAEKYVNGTKADGTQWKAVTFISDNILTLKIDDAKEDIFTIGGVEYSAIGIQPGQYVDKGGEVNITAIANKTGNKSNTNFVVGSNALLQTLSITGPSKIVADGDQYVKLNYVAKDTNGNDVTNYETIVRSTNTLNLSCSEGTLTVKEENDGTAGIYWSDDSKFYSYVDNTYHSGWTNSESQDEIDRTIPLTAVVVGGESNNYLLSVSDKRRPVAIKAIKSINGGANAIVANGSATVNFVDDNQVEYLDQYGEVMKASAARFFFDYAGQNKFGKTDAHYYGIKADFTTNNSLNSAVDTVLVGNSDEMDPSEYQLTLTATDVPAVMNDTVKFSIAYADKNNDTSDKWDVSGKVLNLSIATVPITSLSNLAIADVAKQFVTTNYTNAVNGAAAELDALKADTSVKGALTVDTTENSANTVRLVKVVGTYDGKTLDVPEAYIDRTVDKNFTYKPGTGRLATVSAGALKVKDLYNVNASQLPRKDATLEASANVYSSTTDQDADTLMGTLKKSVTVSDEKPKAAKVAWLVWGQEVNAFTVNALNTGYAFEDKPGTGMSNLGDHRIDLDWETYATNGKAAVAVYDQYGQLYTTDAVEFTIKDYTENTGAFAHKQNNSSVSANGSKAVTINGAELGDTFTITATIEGVSAQAKVTVGSDVQAFITQNSDADKLFRTTKLGYDR